MVKHIVGVLTLIARCFLQCESSRCVTLLTTTLLAGDATARHGVGRTPPDLSSRCDWKGVVGVDKLDVVVRSSTAGPCEEEFFGERANG